MGTHMWDDGAHDAVVIPGATGMSDQALEAIFREQWGLPEAEIEDEIPTERMLIQCSDKDEDDFTVDEWAMIRVMRSMCQTAARKKPPSARKQRKAVEWLFVNGTLEQTRGWSFHLMCEALRARPWVIQTMIQHLWFRRMAVPDPLPFLADLLPETLQSEAIMCAWESGAAIMNQVWKQPGGPLDVFRRETPFPATFDRDVDALSQAGLLGVSADRAWVSSRSATFIRPGQRVSWSRSFIGD